ncbi:type II toxin-antitoxin system PemK/MazF family toxin [Companilactobacillus kedongensis]|uniref:type II toxin-antitoxin system PemK/MazF family toxin n=1 Tax=Companilactobacillus kedongensis TaxID=2486004 RepID=UPI000F78F587|nr:type II toxin-antitoxin system PemK/MazF family toxin [Companilactobacillus kedongensis]
MSSYAYHGYTPHQGDLIFLNFDPSVGREIKKRRPAIVMSSDQYNSKTGYIAICPITSTIRDSLMYVDIHARKISGQINAIQFRTIDFISSDRDIQFVERSNPRDFMQTAKIINDSFSFENIIHGI